MEKYRANERLATEIARRFQMVQEAVEQIDKCNYGNARDLLTKVLNFPMQIEVFE